MGCNDPRSCAGGDAIPILAPANEPTWGICARQLRGGVPLAVMTRLGLGQAEVTASEPVEVGECTAGSVDLVVFAFSALSFIEVSLQVGSDRENWSRFSTTVVTRAGFARLKFRGLGARFLRLYYRAEGQLGGVGILTTTIAGCAEGTPGWLDHHADRGWPHTS